MPRGTCRLKSPSFRRQAQFRLERGQADVVDDPAQALFLVPVLVPVQEPRGQAEGLGIRQVGGDEVR